MARSKTRTQSCDRTDALNRLAQAESFLGAAELIVDDDGDDATPSVAASQLPTRPAARDWVSALEADPMPRPSSSSAQSSRAVPTWPRTCSAS